MRGTPEAFEAAAADEGEAVRHGHVPGALEAGAEIAGLGVVLGPAGAREAGLDLVEIVHVAVAAEERADAHAQAAAGYQQVQALPGQLGGEDDALVDDVREVRCEGGAQGQVEVEPADTLVVQQDQAQVGADLAHEVEVRHILAGVVVVGIGRQGAAQADVELDPVAAQEAAAHAGLVGAQDLAAIGDEGEHDALPVVLAGRRVVREPAGGAGEAELEQGALGLRGCSRL